MEIRTMKVSEITPAGYNPRKALNPDDPEYQALARSLAKFGVVEPLVWNETTKTLVGGHQRLAVLLAGGVDEVEVSVVRLTPAKEKALNIALNKIKGEWDYDKLAELIGSMSATARQLTGFAAHEIAELMAAQEESAVYEEPEGEEGEGEEAEEEPDDEDNNGKNFVVCVRFSTEAAADAFLRDQGYAIKMGGARTKAVAGK